MFKSETPNEKPTYWKSLDELNGKEGLTSANQEFPEGYNSTPAYESPITRRGFMALLSASMAITAASCRRPDHKLVPSVKNSEYITPGIPVHYATTYMHGNVAHGLLVKSSEGRPVKVDGNDLHPINKGKSNIFVQASILNLYHPDRIRGCVVIEANGTSSTKRIVTPKSAFAMTAKAIQESAASGKQVRILLGPHASPTLSAISTEVGAISSNVKVLPFASINTSKEANANKAVLGIDGELVADLSVAECILSVDRDFLGADRNSVYLTRGFSTKRKPSHADATMSYLIVAESTFSQTSISADKRVKLQGSEIEGFLAEVYKNVAQAKGADSNAVSGYSYANAANAKEVAAKLIASGDKAVVMVGAHCSEVAHGICAMINNSLGNIGSGKILSKALPNSSSNSVALSELRSELKSGAVDTVIMVDCNPLYTGDADLRNLLSSVKHRISATYFEDETAQDSTLNIPLAHQYESWGDGQSFDGTLSIQQPLVSPLNADSVSVGDFFFHLGKALNDSTFGEMKSYYDYVRSKWNVVAPDQNAWESMLRNGVSTGTLPDVVVSYNSSGISSLKKNSVSSGLSVLVIPDSRLLDGEFSNNGWMMELPDAVTKHCWDNVAMMSAKTASGLNAQDNDVVLVKTANGAVELPVLIQPGMADNVIVTTLGYGRNWGTTSKEVGANTYTLLDGTTGSGYYSATVEKLNKKNVVARTQSHFTLRGKSEHEDRDIVREITVADLKKKAVVTKEHAVEGEEVKGQKFTLPITVNKGFEYNGHKWGMVIDLSSCTGCNACVVACQSENNISTVGKEDIKIGREMHWMRLDLYYKGDSENPQAVVEPMLCQHCDNAPCENVCPVAATTHSPEGLNEMTYNRCVGTRYCLNNCPYKVRRFNFSHYNTETRQPYDMVYNPEVSVRVRGVMEKCTFCVQRINEAKYHAKDKGHSRVPDGEMVTACQQACPASAIQFGNLNDTSSNVSKLKNSERSFLVLEELNVRPNVVYLAKVRHA